MDRLSLAEQADLFRERAEYMLKKAGEAPTMDAKVVFLSMAQGYCQMADKAQTAPMPF
jgi:hypothetical protein